MCYTQTHARLTALFLGLPVSASTRKVKPIWILLKQETVSSSGISWAICKSAPRSRQITAPAPHHSVFLQAGCPACRPNNSVKALKANSVHITCLYKIRIKHSYVMQHLLFLRCWFPARFQNAWNAFNRNLTDTISEARQAWIDLPQLFSFPLCQLTHNLKHMIWTHLMH